MVHCATVNCNNNTYKKGQNTGVSFYCLAKEKSWKKCLINLKKENPPNDARLCHLHFEDLCFKYDLEVSEGFLLFLANSNVLIISFLLCLEILKNIEYKIIQSRTQKISS